jgi:hypothetical protein
MASAFVSGTLKISGTSNLVTRTFSAFTTVSQFAHQEIVINSGLSNFIVSLANVSNPNFLWITATAVVRVNANPALDSQRGSAGQEFSDLYAVVGNNASAVSGSPALHFSNSSGDSATITIYHGM